MMNGVPGVRDRRGPSIVTICVAALLSMTVASCNDKLNVTGPDPTVRALQPVWRTTVGTQPGNFALDIEAAADGHVFVTGFTRQSDNGRALYLFEVDQAGNLLWEKNFTSSGLITPFENFGGMSVLPTEDGGCIAAGYGTENASAWLYIVKVRDDGEKEWDSLYTEGSNGRVGNCIAAAPNGDFVIGGATSQAGAFLIRFDGRGGIRWEKSFQASGIGGEMTYAVTAVPDVGGFLISGQLLLLGDMSQTLYVVRTDDDGNKLWKTSFNEGFYDCGRSIIPEADGGCLVTAGPMPMEDSRTGLNLVRLLPDGSVGMRRVLRRAWGTAGRLTRTADGGYIAVSAEGNIARADSEFRDLWAGLVTLPEPFQSVSSVGPDGTIHIAANTDSPHDFTDSRVEVMKIEPRD